MKYTMTGILLALTLVLSACGSGDAESTPTLDPVQVQTEAVQTFAAGLTQNAPTQTPFPTLTASATFAPFATGASTLPAFTQVAGSPTASCYQLRFVSDVTIPDNTAMTPGQTFTKTWKVKNTGTCVWDAGFKFTFVGGESMNGATYTLPSSVPANGELDISIGMTAPTNKSGALRGNWRMQTAGGQYFGDEVYVLIIVGGSTATNTSVPPTATTEPPTATTEPAP